MGGMKKVLVINSSAKLLNSRSRKLTEVFVDYWKSLHEHPVVRYRELGNAAVPHVNDRWIAAAFKAETARSPEDRKALETSDTYIKELREADIIVLGSPMYNWSIPSSLKAYIDQIFRVNETFKVNTDDIRNPYVGLLENKTLFLLFSRGDEGYGEGEYNERMDFQSGYLKTVFNIIGVNDIHMVAINGRPAGPERFMKTAEGLRQKVATYLTLQER
jgi:FMN-dependent NADH-azoreductase